MSKINNLVAGIATLAAVTATNAQQVLKKITQNTNDTTVELFAVRHGTTSNNVIWPNGFDVSTSQSTGSVVLSNSTWNLTYSYNNGINWWTPSIPNEQVGNWTFETVSAWAWTLTDFIEDQWWGSSINISIPTVNSNRDEVSDGNTNIDLLHTKFVLPNTLNNGSPVPTGTRAICGSRDGVDLNNWSTMTPSKNVVLRFDGTSWIIQTTYPNGNPVNPLNDATLWVDDFAWSKQDNSKVFPNPIEDRFSFDDGDSDTHEKMKYQFVDLNGRVIESGTLTENQPQSLSQDHKPGVEILVLEDEDGNKFSKKALLK